MLFLHSTAGSDLHAASEAVPAVALERFQDLRCSGATRSRNETGFARSLEWTVYRQQRWLLWW